MFGIFAFIVTLFFLVLVHEWGHFITARKLGVKVEEFGFGFPPRIAKKKWRGTDYSFNWLPFGGFVRLKGEDGEYKSSDSYASQSAPRRSLIVLAGVFMNLLVAVVLFSLVAGIGFKQDITLGVDENAMVSDVSHVIAGVISNGPADGILEAGDQIKKVNGQQFSSINELQEYLSSREEQLEIDIERNGQLMEVAVSPGTFEVSGSEEEFYGLGTELQSIGTVSYAWWRAPWEGVQMTAEIFQTIAVTLWGAITSLFSDKPATGFEVTGPIGIAVLTGDIVQMGISTFIQFVAILSINLAFLNLLPIPALDGGRFAFLLYEMIFRRALSEKIELTLHKLGFTLLMLLVIVVTIMDVGRFGGGITDFIRQIF